MIIWNSNMNSETRGSGLQVSLKNLFVEPEPVSKQIQFKDLAKFITVNELKQPIKAHFKERDVTVQSLCNLTLRYSVLS